MANTAQKTVQAPVEHPLTKNHTIISTKLVDFDNLTAYESAVMAAGLILAVTLGTVLQLSTSIG